ncbi:MAG: ABC transporter permease [Chloroflexi bacterium]|nr:ABC transporter permease [Chloroflexota bacterium]
MALKSTTADSDSGGPLLSKASILNLREEAEQAASGTLWMLALQRLRRDYLTLIAIAILVILFVLSVMAPLITDVLDVSYRKTNVSQAFLKVGAEGHLLGTDDLGRDQLARLLYAGQVSMNIAFSAAFLSLVIGMSMGVIAGYYQGSKYWFVDEGLMWAVTTLNSVPSLFLLIIVAAMLKPSVWSLILVLAFLSWTGTMRFVRGETLALREREYIVSARAIGASDIRIMFFHILPNVFSVIIINLASDIGGFILIESALSFLNLGVRPPTPSWGNMLSDAQSFFTKGVHLVICPGSLIVMTVLCLFLIGDGLRDAFDPQASRKQA